MKEKILIVDDDVVFADLYKERLGLAGYEVDAESRSSKALEKIAKFKPDVVLLDLMMPEVSGQEILGKVKDNKSLEKTKVVILTALAGNRDRDALTKKADGYIVKSEILPKDLVGVIEKILKK